MVVLSLNKGSNEVLSRIVDGDRGPRTRPPFGWLDSLIVMIQILIGKASCK